MSSSEISTLPENAAQWRQMFSSWGGGGREGGAEGDTRPGVFIGGTTTQITDASGGVNTGINTEHAQRQNHHNMATQNNVRFKIQHRAKEQFKVKYLILKKEKHFKPTAKLVFSKKHNKVYQ